MPYEISIDKAAQMLPHLKRVLVIGCSGGGKTTLALKISDAFDLNYISLDRDVRWLPSWQVRPRQEQREILQRLVQRSHWVMDGSGGSTFDIRVPRADLIIWVRVARRVALSGLASRVFQNYGKVRTAMPEGCPERFPDWEFLSYIWHFERKSAPDFIEQINRHGPNKPLVTLRFREDFARLLGDRALPGA